MIGAVGSTEIVLRAMQESGLAPDLLVTLAPELGRRRHADYVDLSAMATEETEVAFVDATHDPLVLARIRDLAPDVVFVIGWSQIVSAELRTAARSHCIGFHPTLLPALRGRAAIGWTILLGLQETGATLFEIDDGLDDGAILAQTKIALGERETVETLVEKLSAALDRMIRELLPELAAGTARARPQPLEGISYCARRTPAESLIDWSEGAASVDRLIRASGLPYAGAYTFTRKRRLTIWTAEPWPLPHEYHAAPGQIVCYVEDDPVVRCGDGAFLRITNYEADGVRLVGQVRLRDKMNGEE